MTRRRAEDGVCALARGRRVQDGGHWRWLGILRAVIVKWLEGWRDWLSRLFSRWLAERVTTLLTDISQKGGEARICEGLCVFFSLFLFLGVTLRTLVVIPIEEGMISCMCGPPLDLGLLSVLIATQY